MVKQTKGRTQANERERRGNHLTVLFRRRGDYVVMKGALKIITGDSGRIYTHIEKRGGTTLACIPAGRPGCHYGWMDGLLVGPC